MNQGAKDCYNNSGNLAPSIKGLKSKMVDIAKKNTEGGAGRG